MTGNRFTRLALLTPVLLFLVLFKVLSTNTPVEVAFAQDDPVSKGRYLANTICADCHTMRVAGDPYHLDKTKLFGGGEEYAGPWGVVPAKNISSDIETGIGSWTEAEIKRAITEGVSKDGTKLLVMPWEIFRGLADEDVSAIAAYLKTTPAVKNTVPEAKLASSQQVAGFIDTIPPLKAIVPASLYSNPRAVFHDFFFGGAPGSSKPAPAGFRAPEGKDSAARGQYLAQNLLGCTFCHAPNLAGGTPPIFGANITPDRETGIGNWSKEQIVRALREGVRPDGRRLSPVMPVGDLAYGKLTDDDVYNVIAFLQSVPPVRRAPGEPNPIMAGPPPGGPPGAGAAPSALPRTGEQDIQALLASAAGLGISLLVGGAIMRRRRKTS